MEFIMRNWQKILIMVLIILYMSTCVSNCSHKNEIRTMKETYSQSDSIITTLQSEISSYEVRVKDLNIDVLELKSKNEMLISANKDLNKALERKVIVNINKEEVDGK